VANFITVLESSDYYRDVDLKVTKQIKEAGVKLQSFEIDCKEEAPADNDSQKEG
jgi:type IV pilus assembly protein PilN